MTDGEQQTQASDRDGSSPFGPANCSASDLHLACVRCGNTLSKQGALMFSPPDRDQRVRKIHLCSACWEMIELWVKE